MKKIVTFLLALILTFSVVNIPSTDAKQIFSDVSTTHSNYEDIMYLLENKVIDESSKYGISDIVTREEVAVMIAKAVGLDGTPTITKFTDVPMSNTNSGYIQSAVDAGIINGYPDGTFKPSAKVTRGHMAAFIARAFDLPKGSKTFKDVPKGNTAYEAVSQLAKAGITTGYEDGTFKPSNNLTRGHISAFLARAMKYGNGSVISIQYDIILEFPADRYPQTASHIKKAIGSGESAVCTIDRDGADENREESLVGIATKDGYDRDEFPMAMCAEGGEGASVMYVESSDNRGAGSWVGNQLEDYPNGTRVLFKIVGNTTIEPKPTESTPTTKPKPQEQDEEKEEEEEPAKTYKNCTEMRKDYPKGVDSSHPAYEKKHDRDGDGYACEK